MRNADKFAAQVRAREEGEKFAALELDLEDLEEERKETASSLESACR